MLISIKRHTHRLPDASPVLGWTPLPSLKWMSHILAHADQISELQRRQIFFQRWRNSLLWKVFCHQRKRAYWWYKHIPSALGGSKPAIKPVVLFKRWFSVLIFWHHQNSLAECFIGWCGVLPAVVGRNGRDVTVRRWRAVFRSDSPLGRLDVVFQEKAGVGCSLPERQLVSATRHWFLEEAGSDLQPTHIA